MPAACKPGLSGFPSFSPRNLEENLWRRGGTGHKELDALPATQLIMCETLEETRSTKFSQEKSPTYLNTFFIHQHSTPDRSSVAPFMPAADAEIIELKSYAAA